MNTILHLLEKGDQVSLARFNDGEIGAILGDLTKTSRGKQIVTPSLIEKLNYALNYRSENYFIGFPCPICYPKYYEYTRKAVGNYPYQILSTATSNNHYRLFKKELLITLKGKKVLYIGGSDITTFKSSWYWYKCKNVNTEAESEQIIANLGDFDVYLFAIGAISRWCVAKMHEKGKSALDVGSLFDPETRGVYLKPHKWIGKYKNEQNYCPICNY